MGTRIDDYLGDSDSRRRLVRLSENTPSVLHSVDLSIGSSEAITNRQRLSQMRDILTALNVQELSDHLAFTRVPGKALGHFVPLWRVEEGLELTSSVISEIIQDALGARLVLENIASLFDPGGEMTVAEFLNELVRRTGCGVLLDITNLTLSEKNGFCDASAELERLDLESVTGVHVAGGSAVDGIHYDAHAFPVADGDLQWLQRLRHRIGNCRTAIIERDGRRDAIAEIRLDLQRLRSAVTAAPSGHRAWSAHD